MSIGNEVGVSVETCWSSWDIGGGWFWRLREEGAEPGGGVSKAAVDSARWSTVGPFGVPARLAGSGLMSIGAWDGVSRTDGSRSSSGILVAPMSHAKEDGGRVGLDCTMGRVVMVDAARTIASTGAASGVRCVQVGVGGAGGMEECLWMDNGDGWIR